jgi:putative DNA primase/helicase
LEEEGYTFNESIDFLEEKFDVDVQIGYNPHDYFSHNIHDNNVFDAEKMAEEIMESHDFVNIVGEEQGLRIYKDGVWKGHQEAVEVIEREVNERLGKETGSHYRSNTKNMIQRDRRIQIQSEDFTHPEGKLPFKNGVYDLESGDFVDHNPQFFFTFKFDAEYRPDADRKSSVNEFIKDIAPESEDKQKKLKEVAALSVAPWKPFDVMPILFGKGSNGKNQYVEVIKKILGKGKYHISSAKTLSNDKFEKASLQDKLMVFFDEFGAGDPNKLKRLTDSEQSVRAMHQESEVKETFFLPIFAANNLPNVNDDSEGFYRRWQIIDFNQKFTDKEDDNPDMMKPSELEDKYMNQEDIDLFATELISHLEDVLNSNSLTNSQSQSEVRVIWEEKASAVYSFIDRYFTQGKYDPASSNVSDDYVIKEEMARLVNAYLESKNISKTDPSHITRVLEKHPDLRVNTNARLSMNDGLKPDRPTAYEGLRIKDKMLHDVRGVLPLYAWRSTQLKQLTNYRKYLDIVEDDKTAMTLYFLESHRDDSVEMTELIKQLNLSTKQLQSINNCDYIKKQLPEVGGLNVPQYSVDMQKVEEDLPSNDQMKDSNGIVVRPLDWVKKQVESWSKETEVDKQEMVEKGSLAGFDESSIENAYEELIDQGKIYEPKPGKVAKL